MNYLVFKSLHIISVVTWFAGLFYMPRLFVYFAEANAKSPNEKEVLQSQFKIMQKRLWYGITWPSSVAVLIFGSALVVEFWPITNHPWLIYKLIFVIGLYAYHLFLHKYFRLRAVFSLQRCFLNIYIFLILIASFFEYIYFFTLWTKICGLYSFIIFFLTFFGFFSTSIIFR